MKDLIVPGQRPEEQQQVDEALAPDEVTPEAKETVILRRMLTEHRKDLVQEYDRNWYQRWWEEKGLLYRTTHPSEAPGGEKAGERLKALIDAAVEMFRPTAEYFARSAARFRGTDEHGRPLAASDYYDPDLPNSDGPVIASEDVQEAQKKKVDQLINGKE